MENEYYVVVTELDCPKGSGYKNGGTLVHETYIKNATLENAQDLVYLWDGMYGKARIAKLQFIEE